MGMVLLAAMLWGTTGTAQTLAPAGLPAYWVGALRLLVSGVFFWAYLLVEQRGNTLRARFARVQWPWVLLAGASMAAYNLTFFAGVKASSVAIGTAIALGSGPIWAGLLQTAVLRRCVRRQRRHQVRRAPDVERSRHPERLEIRAADRAIRRTRETRRG